MAGKMDFEVSANPEKAIADLSKIINKQDAVIDKLKSSNREATKTQKAMGDMGSGLGKIAQDAAGMATGFISATGAMALMRTGVQLLKAEFEDMVRKQGDAARSNMTFAEGATSAIMNYVGSSGLDANVARMKTTIQGVPSVGLSEGVGLLSEYAGARPAGSMADALGVISKSGSGGTAADRRRLVGLVGQIQNLIPEKSADDSYDIATALIRDSGQMSDQLGGAMQGLFKMKSLGADPENLLGRLTHTVQAKQKPRIFSTMASVLGQIPSEKTMRRPGSGPLDPATMAKNEIVGLSPDEVLAWLDANPDRAGLALGSTWASVSPAFGPGVGSEGLAALQGYQAENLYGSEVANREKSGYFGMMKVGQENAALIEDMQVGNTSGARAGQVRKMIRETMESLPEGGKFGREWGMKKFEAVGWGSGNYGDAAVDFVQDIYPVHAPWKYERRKIGGKDPSWITERIDNPDYSPEICDALNKLSEQIDRFCNSVDTIESNSLNPTGGLD